MATDIYDGLVKRGLSPVHAGVLAGNIDVESSGNPTAWNPKEAAGGLLQWRLDRLDNLMNYAKASGRDPGDREAQLDYLVAEMTEGPEARNAAAFLAASDPRSANDALKRFIRYAPGTEAKRLTAAMGYMPKDGGTLVASAPTKPAEISDDELLKMWAAPGGSGGAPAAGGAAAPTSDDELLKMWTKAPATVGDGTEPVKATPDAAGGVVEDVLRNVATGANAFVDAIPIVGPALTGFNNVVSSGLSQLTDNPRTPEEWAALKKAQAEQYGIADTVGGVAGTVAPYLAAAPFAGAARLLGMSGTVPQMALMGGGSNALIAGADTLARGGTLEEASQNAKAGALIGAAAPIAGKLVGGLGNKLLGKVSPERAQLAELARTKYKIPLGAAQIGENQMMKFADDAVGKLPFSGGTLSNTEVQAAVNRGVAKEFGENADKLTPDVMDRARTRIGAMFEDAAKKTPVIAEDAAFDQAMTNAFDNAQLSLTDQQMGPIARQFENIVGKFQQGGGAIDGKTYQELTKKGAPLDVAIHSSDPGIRQAGKAFREAIDGAFERSATPEVRESLKAARTQWKAMKTVEDLAEKGVIGDISPALLLNAVRNSYGDMAYGGGGNLAELARIGQAFLKKPPSSGTAERLMSMAALSKLAPLATVGGASTAAMNIGSIPIGMAIGAGSIPAYLAAASGAGALMRSPALANKLIGNSLGRTANPNAVTAGNKLVRSGAALGTAALTGSGS